MVLHRLKSLNKEQLLDKLSQLESEVSKKLCSEERCVIKHELEASQIKLEMQNRDLIESQRLLEETRDKYADLYDFAPERLGLFVPALNGVHAGEGTHTRHGLRALLPKSTAA